MRQASHYIDLRTGKIKYYDMDMVYEFTKQIVDFYDECGVLYYTGNGPGISVKDMNRLLHQLLNHELFTSPRFGSDHDNYESKDVIGLKRKAIREYGHKFYDPEEFQEKADKILKLLKQVKFEKLSDTVDLAVMAFDMKEGKVAAKVSKSLQLLERKILKLTKIVSCYYDDMKDNYNGAMREYTRVLTVYMKASQEGVSREDLYKQAGKNKNLHNLSQNDSGEGYTIYNPKIRSI